MILTLVAEAVQAGARQKKAAEVIGISPRTLQRWKAQNGGEDKRFGPKTTPKSKLSASERQKVLSVLNSPENCDLSPKQIVPKLADQGRYLASESTMYRILHDEKLLNHRGKAKAPHKRYKPKELVATGPNQVWSWDITYLKSPVKGVFYYLYMVMDVWSRKVVGWEIHLEESSDHAAWLIKEICQTEDVDEDSLTIHMDNGSPMKGSTLRSTLEALGVAASYSRPSQSNDNPYSESLFKTLKYRPEYPSGPFKSLGAAQQWVEEFVNWYNTIHFHSAIRFVTPEERHSGKDIAILSKRHKVYSKARRRNPERWSKGTRNWEQQKIVTLNPDKTKKLGTA